MLRRRVEYFSDTNTSTYAVPDTYAAAGDLLPLGDPGTRLTGAAGGPPPPMQPSSSFKPFGYSSSPPPLPPPPHPRDLYGGEGGGGGLSLQGCSGNSCYAVPEMMAAVELPAWTRDVVDPSSSPRAALQEFSRDSLRLVEKLGEGPHGEVDTRRILVARVFVINADDDITAARISQSLCHDVCMCVGVYISSIKRKPSSE